jgi:hypothetical protein
MAIFSPVNRRNAIGALLTLGLPRLSMIDRVKAELEGSAALEVVRALPLYRGLKTLVTLEGAGLDSCREVEVGPDVQVQAGSLKKTQTGISFVLVPSASASLGARDLRLRYPVELTGPVTFPVRVLRNGEVTAVEPRRVPPNQKVTLRFTGRDLGNADILRVSYFRDARVLPGGGTESSVQVELVFTREGRFDVPLYDAFGPPRPASVRGDPGGYRRQPGAFVEVRS